MWDPGSPSGIVLTCSGLSLGEREREDDQVKERIGWSKVNVYVCVCVCVCVCVVERERERERERKREREFMKIRKES